MRLFWPRGGGGSKSSSYSHTPRAMHQCGSALDAVMAWGATSATQCTCSMTCLGTTIRKEAASARPSAMQFEQSGGGNSSSLVPDPRLTRRHADFSKNPDAGHRLGNEAPVTGFSFKMPVNASLRLIRLLLHALQPDRGLRCPIGLASGHRITP